MQQPQPQLAQQASPVGRRRLRLPSASHSLLFAFSFDNVNVNVINKTGSRFLRVRPLKSLTFKCAFLLCTSPGGATGYNFATFKLCLGAAAVQEFVELRQFFAVSSTLALKFALSLSCFVAVCVRFCCFVVLWLNANSLCVCVFVRSAPCWQSSCNSVYH